MEDRTPYNANGHGGARKGAGRPKSSRETCSVTIRITKRSRDILADRAKKMGVPLSSYLRWLIIGSDNWGG